MRTLADKIIEAAASPADPFTLARLAHTATAIKSAERLVLSQDAREAGRLLLLSRPSSLVEALRWARPPFDRSWIEWETPDHPDPINAVRVRCQQIGCYIEAIPNTRNMGWRFWTAWSYNAADAANSLVRTVPQTQIDMARTIGFRETGIGIAAIEIGFDLSAAAGRPSALFPDDLNWIRPTNQTVGMLAKLRDDRHNNIRYALTDPSELQALNLLLAPIRWRVRLDELSMQQFAVSHSFGPAGLIAAIDDVRDEIGPLIAALIMLNSKNCVETKLVVQPPKLNRARIKNGKPPLLDHSVVLRAARP
jgi:hypothetical protein